MSQSGPTPEVTQFIASLDALIQANHSAITTFASNAERVTFLKKILIEQNAMVPRNAISLMFQALRAQDFTDKTQLIINLLEKIKEEKSFGILTKNSNRADYIEGRLIFTPDENTFSKQEIINILQNEGYEDQYDLNDVIHAILTNLDPRNNPAQTMLIWFLLVMIPLSIHNIFSSLKYAPGNYARNFTLGLTTQTLKQSISRDNHLLQRAIKGVEWSLQAAIMFRYLPSLGMVFQYFPEMLDPKTYGEKAAHSLEETFGPHVFLVLTPIALLMSMYGPGVIQALLSKIAHSAPVQAAHEFCTLMRGGEEAAALLEANPELKDSFIVHGGLNWSYKKTEKKQLTTVTPVDAHEERFAAAMRPD